MAELVDWSCWIGLKTSGLGKVIEVSWRGETGGGGEAENEQDR